MITFRREHLDRNLENYVHLMRGRVLDIGGVKIKKRGRFIPPLDNVDSWKYLNHNPATNPDYCSSAENIPLDAGSVDTVVMTEVLEYLEKPEVAFSEIFRVLSGHGVCLLSIPLLHAVHGDWREDRSRYTAVKINEMADAAGFRGVEIQTMGGLGSVIFDLVHVAGGYANEDKNLFALRILSKISRLVIPLFRVIDTVTRHEHDYITTGYFAVLRK